MLQRVSACCSVLQRVAACGPKLVLGAYICQVYRVAACCNVLQHVTARYSASPKTGAGAAF